MVQENYLDILMDRGFGDSLDHLLLRDGRIYVRKGESKFSKKAMF